MAPDSTPTDDAPQPEAASPPPPPKPPRVPLICTSVNGPLRDIFDDVDPAKAGEPGPDEDLSALKSYVLCFVERSGSTMLSDLMKNTGVLGIPDEFVNPRGPMYYNLIKWPSVDLPQYFAKARKACSTPNGVFGMKTIYADFEPLIKTRMIGRLLGAPRFIFLTRKDVVLQAISSYIARHRGLWHSSDRHLKANANVDFDAVEIPFDQGAILELVDRFFADRLRWERFFALYGIDPLRIEYESLTPENMRGVLDSICAEVGVAPDFKDEKLTTKLEILRDDRSLEWAERIRREFRL